jgi:hypothetical protein
MKMKSQMEVNVCFEKFCVNGIANGGYPKHSAERIPVSSKSSFRQSLETLMDLQSYSLMEERYGIQEEGIF